MEISTKQLIAENNEKRAALNEENLKLYEDFLLYIRTDLRIAEQEAEELLMELLDHLLEAQKEGKTATDLFGTNPRTYANELIAGLPSEKKRKVIPFIASQICNLIGWFSIVFAIVQLVLPRFTEVKEGASLGSLIIILTAILLLTGFGVKIIFKLVRSTLFVPKKHERHSYWKAGIVGATSFALILFIAWVTPEFGPKIHFDWWVYLIAGGALIVISKILSSKALK